MICKIKKIFWNSEGLNSEFEYQIKDLQLKSIADLLKHYKKKDKRSLSQFKKHGLRRLKRLPGRRRIIMAKFLFLCCEPDHNAFETWVVCLDICRISLLLNFRGHFVPETIKAPVFQAVTVHK